MYKIEIWRNVLMSGRVQEKNEEMIICLKPYFGFFITKPFSLYAIVRFCSDVSLSLSNASFTKHSGFDRLLITCIIKLLRLNYYGVSLSLSKADSQNHIGFDKLCLTLQ